jgi:hypothetical protein
MKFQVGNIFYYLFYHVLLGFEFFVNNQTYKLEVGFHFVSENNFFIFSSF